MADLKHRYKMLADPSDVFSMETKLPTERPVAVYYRQSTIAQVGNISTQIQTIDMVEELKRRGWNAEDITLIDMDAGVSGTTKIDERKGMRLLFELISEGRIGAVACEDEDRLFRDVTQIQVNIFIEACRAARVVVFTPSMVYDFSNELIGSFHARQFRFKSELAAEYISTFVKGKLHRAKRRLAMEGRWFGGRLPPGYMFDTRKTLPDGKHNEHWRRYVPFPAYAEVVKEYFQLFLSYAGNTHATLRHIHEHGPYYPDPAICLPPPGFRAVYPMQRYEHGYCPGRDGLLHLLTNAVYVGHWVLNGSVVIYDNHTPIVPEEAFWQAFNHLSKVTLTGLPNPYYQPFIERARPTLDCNRTEERPLYAGLIIWQDNGNWRPMGTIWQAQHQHYVYCAESSQQPDRYQWSRQARYVDEEITTLLIKKLTKTFETSTWDETLNSFSSTFDKDRKRIQSQLTTLERVMENQVLSLDTLTTPPMIRDAEARYVEAQAEHERLKRQLTDVNIEGRKLQAIADLKDSCLPALANWSNTHRDKKRAIAHAFIEKIEASPIDLHGLHLSISWRDRTMDELTIAIQSRSRRRWLGSEIDTLLALVDCSASQVEIAATFPDRTWEKIRHQVWKFRGKHSVETIDPKPINDNETYPQYLERFSDPTIKQAGSGDRWTSEEEHQLLNLLDSGANQVRLAAAFPSRRWWRIRWKITQLRGNGVVIPEIGKIKRNETILDFCKRTGEDTNEYNVASQPISSPVDYPGENHALAPSRYTAIRGRVQPSDHADGAPVHQSLVRSHLPP